MAAAAALVVEVGGGVGLHSDSVVVGSLVEALVACSLQQRSAVGTVAEPQSAYVGLPANVGLLRQPPHPTCLQQ